MCEEVDISFKVINVIKSPPLFEMFLKLSISFLFTIAVSFLLTIAVSFLVTIAVSFLVTIAVSFLATIVVSFPFIIEAEVRVSAQCLTVVFLDRLNKKNIQYKSLDEHFKTN